MTRVVKLTTVCQSLLVVSLLTVNSVAQRQCSMFSPHTFPQLQPIKCKNLTNPIYDHDTNLNLKLISITSYLY